MLYILVVQECSGSCLIQISVRAKKTYLKDPSSGRLKKQGKSGTQQIPEGERDEFYSISLSRLNAIRSECCHLWRTSNMLKETSKFQVLLIQSPIARPARSSDHTPFHPSNMKQSEYNAGSEFTMNCNELPFIVRSK